MTPKEKAITSALFLLTVFFAIASLWNIYLTKTEKVAAYGKTYTEALVGEPQFINPIFITSNDVDRDISKLIYSGLMKYDENGDLATDLASSYKVSKNGKEYTFYLKKNVYWHDQKPFTADDVEFTISAILNPLYSSPLRASWQGIKIEKINDYEIKFILSNTYAPFLEKTTLGILPKHIWEKTDPKNIILSPNNLNPVGTGPFKLKQLAKNKNGEIVSFEMEANENYYGKVPFINEVIFYFYDDEEQAINAYQKGDVLGVSNVSPKNKHLITNKDTNIYNLNIPKYFSIFFNQNQSVILSDKNVREALAYATNKKEINDRVFLGETRIINSPILPNLPGYNSKIKKYEFSPDKAIKILNDNGWKDSDGDGILDKKISKKEDPKPLEITLVTSDFIDLAKTAEIIKEQWLKIGVKVNVENYNIEELKQNIIKSRNYDALIFGEVLSHEPDPFAFWHSTQKKYPGLNLALYSNRKVDELLEEARQSLDTKKRNEKLQKFQELLISDLPAIFLYSPNYLYPVSTKVKNIKVKNISIPSERFTGIENWYIKTQRIQKIK